MQKHIILASLEATAKDLVGMRNSFILDDNDRESLDRITIEVASVALNLHNVQHRVLADQVLSLLNLAMVAYDSDREDVGSNFACGDLINGTTFFMGRLVEALSQDMVISAVPKLKPSTLTEALEGLGAYADLSDAKVATGGS